MLCENYMGSGVCISAGLCTFAHGRHELRPINFKGDFDQKIRNTPNWKTSLCVFFCDEGICRQGDECDYAHGDIERRLSSQNWSKGESPTVPCRFFVKGHCKVWTTYGHVVRQLR
jgi:hypothetical protein